MQNESGKKVSRHPHFNLVNQSVVAAWVNPAFVFTALLNAADAAAFCSILLTNGQKWEVLAAARQ